MFHFGFETGSSFGSKSFGLPQPRSTSQQYAMNASRSSFVLSAICAMRSALANDFSRQNACNALVIAAFAAGVSGLAFLPNARGEPAALAVALSLYSRLSWNGSVPATASAGRTSGLNCDPSMRTAGSWAVAPDPALFFVGRRQRAQLASTEPSSSSRIYLRNADPKPLETAQGCG
jgi:hypothetical protein